MSAFPDSTYLAPASLEELIACLSRSSRPKLFAGGTDLLVQLQQQTLQVDTLINIKQVAELSQLSLDEQGLLLGAAVSCRELSTLAALAQHYPGLLEAAQLIGSVQIQSRCSIGGNLCNGSPAADTLAALIVNEARCRIVSPRGERILAVEDFIIAPGTTALAGDEVLVDIRIPANPPATADAYLRLTPRTEMDIAVASAAVKLRMDREGFCREARVAIAAVAPRPLLVVEAGTALVDTQVDAQALQSLQDAVRAAASPISDKRGSAAYRLHVIGVLAKRAALLARARALQRKGL